MKQKKEYDMAIVGKALTGLALRVAVSGYIIYLAWKIVSDVISGDSPIPEWGAWLIFAVFVAASVLFCVFAWKQFRLLRKMAELPPTSSKPEPSADNDSGNTED